MQTHHGTPIFSRLVRGQSLFPGLPSDMELVLILSRYGLWPNTSGNMACPNLSEGMISFAMVFYSKSNQNSFFWAEAIGVKSCSVIIPILLTLVDVNRIKTFLWKIIFLQCVD
ncbi:hypothetical protein CHS0354_003802 [Potamilus streckersoni]|uniref:Uncharacterized protein n=1 Tax=Potamilus streckersoni TaxID=2493646 RepID=A0AAE0W700_9BIVA|nr:hypothetical protein CHS0354_003802 [Potamilus streckersoni]